MGPDNGRGCSWVGFGHWGRDAPRARGRPRRASGGAPLEPRALFQLPSKHDRFPAPPPPPEYTPAAAGDPHGILRDGRAQAHFLRRPAVCATSWQFELGAAGMRMRRTSHRYHCSPIGISTGLRFSHGHARQAATAPRIRSERTRGGHTFVRHTASGCRGQGHTSRSIPRYCRLWYHTV